MKKLSLAVCIVLFAACSSDEVLTATGQEESQPVSVGSEFRNPPEVLAIATEALHDCYPATRASRSLKLENVSFVKSQATRGELGDSLLYVVNVPDDGYRYIYENYQWQTREVGSTIWKPISEEIIDETDQHHIYWGYGKDAIGYYELKVFKYDKGSPVYNYTVGSYYFNITK